MKVNELTWGQGADQALVTVAVVDEKMISDAFEIVGKGRVIVVTCMAAPDQLTVHVSGAELTKYGKTIKGSMFGSLNPHYDIVKLLRLYEEFAAQVARRDHGRGSSRTPTSSGSTSTGRASFWDTQSARPVCASWPPCCGRWTGGRLATRWRPCASAAGQGLSAVFQRVS